MEPNQFTCEQCGGTFDRKRTPEEVQAEYEATFSELERSQEGGKVELCEPCFQEFMEWLKAHPKVRIQ